MFLSKLKSNTELDPDKTLYTWLDDSGKETAKLTYARFDSATSAVAEALTGSYGLNTGETVLLVYPPGLDFITAFVGCLKAGVVAVPVYPPRPGLSKDLSMFISVQNDCGAKVALTNSLYDHAKKLSAFKGLFSTTKTKWPELKWFVTDTDGKGKGTPLKKDPNSDDIAFLQYTSGSTAAPKGVMISHGNLGHNLSTIIEALEAGRQTVVVSWLPCYHDMGLIGSLLGVAYCGGSGAYMSPVAFVKNPVLWLEMASKYRATHLQAPNFAYRLVVRKLREREAKGTAPKGLDLSSLKHIFNAAEPIEAEGMEEFLDTFEAFGLKREAMAPGYGLAEQTVYVCDRGDVRIMVDKAALETDKEVKVLAESRISGGKGKLEAAKEGGRWLVGCGNPHRNPDSGMRVAIVDENTSEALPEDRVGEIWTDSDSKARGYFNMKEKTASDFHAKMQGKACEEMSGRNEWLRTGDIGFLHQGELFICGRMKDLIIVRGRNHYPQDIEHSIEQEDERIRPGCVAAFTVVGSDGKGEHLGIVAEVRDSKAPGMEELSKKLRQRIIREHGVLPYVLVLIKDRTIPKTTSGKISRFRAKAAFEGGQLNEVNRFVGDAETEREEDKADVGDAGDAKSSVASDRLVEIGSKDKGGDNGNLLGESLKLVLQEEVARLIEGDPGVISSDMPLIELGMDSMALTQFKGVLQTEYDTDVSEMELFDEATTLTTIQKRVEGAPPDPRFLTGNASAADPDAPASAQNAAGSTRSTRSAKPQQRKRPKQSLFGCFKICGC